MLEEIKRDAGSWEVHFVPETPREIIMNLNFNSYIVVMETGRTTIEQGNASIAALLADSSYTGVLYEKALNMEDGGHAIAGNGLVSLLGDSEFSGAVNETYKRHKTTQTLNYYLDNFIFPVNGITTYAHESGLTNKKFNIVKGPDKLGLLNDICDRFKCGWQMKHNATMRIGTNGWLWNGWSADPVAIITDIADDEFVDLSNTLTVINAHRITSVEESRNLRTRVFVRNPDVPGAAAGYNIPSVPTFKTLSGTSLRDTIYIEHDRAQNATVAAWVAIKQAEKHDHTNIHLEAEIVGSHWVGRIVPGDKVWVYSQDAGVYNPSGDHAYVGGQNVHPRKVTVESIQRGIPKDAQVIYIGSDTSQTIIDLTPWIDWDKEEDTVTLELGDLKREVIRLRKPRYA
jgi:hypothetical protein